MHAQRRIVRRGVRELLKLAVVGEKDFRVAVRVAASDEIIRAGKDDARAVLREAGRNRARSGQLDKRRRSIIQSKAQRMKTGCAVRLRKIFGGLEDDLPAVAAERRVKIERLLWRRRDAARRVGL